MYVASGGIAKKPKNTKCKGSKSIDCKDNRSSNVGREPVFYADKLSSGKGLGAMPAGKGL